MINQYRNKFNISKNKNKEEPLTEVLVENVRALSDHEILALVVSRVAKDRELFELVINLLEEVESFKLSGTLHKVSLDRDSFWVQVGKRNSLSTEEIDALLGGGSISEGLKYLQILKKYLHDNAMSGLAIEYGMTYDGSDPVLTGIFENKVKVAKGIVLQKESEMKNFCKKVVKTLDVNVSRSLSSDSSQLAYMRQKCAAIFNGRFDLILNPKLYRTPKEAGVSLPHTLSPKDWLSASVSALIDKQFGGKLITCFNEDDFSGIRPYKGEFSDFLIVSSDPDSAYSLSNSPAIHVREFTDGVWDWRRTQQSLRMKVAGEVRSNNVKGIKDDITKALARSEYDAILHYKEEKKSPDLSFLTNSVVGVLVVLDDTVQKFFHDKEAVVRFFRRGYSKGQEVEDNPDYIHVVKASVAEQFSGDDYYPVSLPDFQSVVLFPLDLWALSKHSGKRTNALFNTAYGHRFLKGESAYRVALVYNILQATLTFRMLDNILNTEYNFEEDVAHLRTLLIDGRLGGLIDLLPFTDRKTRIRFIEKTFHSIPGLIPGIFVCPQSSRKGKDEMNEMIGRANMQKIVDMFDDDSENDGSNLVLEQYFSDRRTPKITVSGSETGDLSSVLDDY